MPTYVYEIRTGDPDHPDEGRRFEAVQPMSEDALEQEPGTGLPCVRVVLAPYIGGAHSEAREKRLLSDDNIARTGLTKYVKSDTGRYEKAAGDGPDTIGA